MTFSIFCVRGNNNSNNNNKESDNNSNNDNDNKNIYIAFVTTVFESCTI